MNNRLVIFMALFTAISFMSRAQNNKGPESANILTISFRFKLDIVSERGIKPEIAFKQMLDEWNYRIEIILSSEDNSLHVTKVQSPYATEQTLKKLRNIIIHDFYGRQVTLGNVCDIQTDQSQKLKSILNK